MDDSGIRYRNKKYVDHLISDLQAKYEVTQDCTGGLYCGIKLKWYYKAQKLDISMPGYVKDKLHKFQHPTPTRPQHSPHQWTSPKYESTLLYLAQPEDYSLALNPEEANTFQNVVRTFLQYARAVDPTMLAALNTIEAQQSKSTQETENKVVQLLNYAVTHTEAIIRCHVSGITFHMHSDASFLLAPGSKIRSGGYHYPSEPSSDPKTPPPFNGPIHIICELLARIRPENFSGRNGPPPTTDTSSYRQRDQRRFCEQ